MDRLPFTFSLLFLLLLPYIREIILSDLILSYLINLATRKVVVTALASGFVINVRALNQSPLLQATQSQPPNGSLETPQFLLVTLALISVILGFLLLRMYLNNKLLKKKELQHREVNRRVVTAVNHTDTLIVSLDKHGVIRLINQAAISVHQNWVGKELKAGLNITEATKGSPAETIWKSWMEKSINVFSWSEVCKITVQDRQKYYRVNFSSIQRNDGMYTGLVMMGNDVTFEHEYQSELAEQHRALEKSNSDKEQMMGILAHDLKDSIYSAHSMSKMVLEDRDDFDRDHLIRLFEMLHDNFDKTQDLLESLLAWQKTRNISIETRYEEITLHKVTSEVIANSQEGINRKNLKVENKIPADIILTTDREMLRTVLRNLLSNAIKYTQMDKGVIKIECVKKDGLEIHVKDNGAGMEKKEMETILSGSKGFTKPGTENENGCGIGLFLCQELLRINQSKLQIKSEPGKGADFYFKLRI